jgi:hypothetical protein
MKRKPKVKRQKAGGRYQKKDNSKDGQAKVAYRSPKSCQSTAAQIKGAFDSAGKRSVREKGN